MIRPDATVAAVTDAIAADLGAEVILLHLGTGTYYGLNPVAARIWQLLQHPVPVHDVIAVLRAEYDAEPECLQHDVQAFLSDVLAAGLVRRVDQSAGVRER